MSSGLIVAVNWGLSINSVFRNFVCDGKTSDKSVYKDLRQDS